MPRTAPSKADLELLQVLASRDIKITPSQLERWRAQGLLPRNRRQGLGRGAGSQSALPAGIIDYVDALESQSQQGRSMNRAILAMFMAGVLQPGTSLPAVGALMQTYEAAVRRAFQREIETSGDAREEVAAIAADRSKNCEAAEDDAYAHAEKIAKRQITRGRLRLEQSAAKIGGFRPRSREELEQETQRGLLSAALDELLAGLPDDDETQYSWDNGELPLDVNIWSHACEKCDSKTRHFPTSRDGQLDLLDGATFRQLSQARAIGGAVSMLVPSFRALAAAEPTSEMTQAVVSLISNTAFRFLLREPPKVSPSHPDSIVTCTLFFVNDCRWQTTAAHLLVKSALIWMPTLHGDVATLGRVMRTISTSTPRGQILRSGLTLGPLLVADGVVHAVDLIARSSAPQ